MRMNAMNTIALVLAIIGAINWGLVGLFDFNLVSALFGEMTMLTRIVYVLVGLAGVYLIFGALLSRPHRTDAAHTTTARRDYRSDHHAAPPR